MAISGHELFDERVDKAPRVLIVDDDPAGRLLCSVNMRIEGLVVLEAADGELGLERARCERPDLIVTDVMMPGLNGFELAEALHADERTRRIPLIFLSAEVEPANAVRARELGALAYLTKPCDPVALPFLIAGALEVAGKLEQHRPRDFPRGWTGPTPTRLTLVAD